MWTAKPATRRECLQRVHEKVRHTPPGEWVLGHGWNQNVWPEGFGNLIDLDAVAPDQPVYLTAKSLHAGWANSAALRLAGLNDSSSDPTGGRLGRDEAGHLSGILFESAMRLVESVIPEPGLEQVVSAIHAAQSMLWKMGITSVHDFDRRLCFQALQVLHERGELGLHVLKSIPLEDLQLALDLGLRSSFGDDWLKIGPLKLFADGALGPQTAAMLQPFEGSSDNRGMLFMDSEEVLELGRKAAAGGYNLAVHAIGDRAVHEVLQGIEQLRRLEPVIPGLANRKLRHRIEHLQLIHPDNSARLAELGVVASMQPVHATSDIDIAERYWGPGPPPPMPGSCSSTTAPGWLSVRMLRWNPRTHSWVCMPPSLASEFLVNQDRKVGSPPRRLDCLRRSRVSRAAPPTRPAGKTDLAL